MTGNKQPSSNEGNGPESIEDQARSILLRQLTAAPKSRQQLGEKLASKDIPEDVAEAVLDRFEEVQLIDDAEFAAAWTRSRHRSKGLARRAISQELSQKGVSRQHTEAALEQISDQDEYQAANDLVRKKLRSQSVPSGSSEQDQKQREKITRRLVSMLARKGYAPAMCFGIVKDQLGEIETEDESLY